MYQSRKHAHSRKSCADIKLMIILKEIVCNRRDDMFDCTCQNYSPKYAYKLFHENYKPQDYPLLYVTILTWLTCFDNDKNPLKSAKIIKTGQDLLHYFDLATSEIVKGNAKMKYINKYLYGRSFTTSIVLTFRHVCNKMFDITFYDEWFVYCFKSMIRLHNTFGLQNVETDYKNLYFCFDTITTLDEIETRFFLLCESINCILSVEKYRNDKYLTECIESILNKQIYYSTIVFAKFWYKKRNEKKRYGLNCGQSPTIIRLCNTMISFCCCNININPAKAQSILQSWYLCCIIKLKNLAIDKKSNVCKCKRDSNFRISMIREILHVYHYLLTVCVAMGDYCQFDEYYCDLIKIGHDYSEDLLFRLFAFQWADIKTNFGKYQCLSMQEKINQLFSQTGVNEYLSHGYNSHRTKLAIAHNKQYNESKLICSTICDIIRKPKKFLTLQNIASFKQCHWKKCLKQNKKLRRCGKCLSVYYCSSKCQKRDWILSVDGCLPHRIACKKLHRRF